MNKLRIAAGIVSGVSGIIAGVISAPISIIFCVSAVGFGALAIMGRLNDE